MGTAALTRNLYFEIHTGQFFGIEGGANNPDRINGWYNLAGGGAGFLTVTYDEVTQLTAFLQPYMDLMSFDVRAINQLDYDERISELRAIAGQNRS